MDYRVEKWSAPGRPDEAELRQVLAAEGFSVYKWTDRPGAVYGTHSHIEDQSHWVLSGKLELTIQSFGTVVLDAGDRDIIPAGTHHSARVVGDEPVVYLIGGKTVTGN